MGERNPVDRKLDKPEAGEIFDLLVIGGGINGVGVARDAAGRGLEVALCEMADLAQFTSSSSTKLIHGGLRYLEHYDFQLVRHALQEREVLLHSAPHIIWPLRFILPHHADLRPRWLIRLGLFLYDHLGGRRILPTSRSVDLLEHVAGRALDNQFRKGFEYSDCWVQDARMVVLAARDAQNRGARIYTRTRCTGLKRERHVWDVELQDVYSGDTRLVRARAIVNATGPWVSDTLGLNSTTKSTNSVRQVKGSHVVVDKLFDHDYPYIFQNSDGRVLFAIPFERDFTLLGTTDIDHTGDPADASITAEEIDYICESASEYFRKPVNTTDVVWAYCGVRPLYNDAAENASKITRDFVLHLDDSAAPIVSVFGGKITTFRKLAEDVVDMLRKPLAFSSPAWTKNASLPGGDIANADFDAFLTLCRQQYRWLDDKVLYEYARNYGTEIHRLLKGRHSSADLGQDFGGGLYECEVEYLVESEWAQTPEDILWRRTKKGLRVPEEAGGRLQQWLDVRKASEEN